MDLNQIIAWEQKREKTLCRAVSSVLQERDGCLYALYQALYKDARPYLKMARHGNPLHHTVKVVQLLCEIIITDEKISHDDKAILLAAAIWHDAGFSQIPQSQRKITTKEIKDTKDPVEKEKKREMAIELRTLHALEGAKIARQPLEKHFTSEQTERILDLIRHHDDPTVAGLEESAKKTNWLFAPENISLWRLREADRLWMISTDGVISDVIGERLQGQEISHEGRLQYNVGRHFDERYLYDLFPSEVVSQYGFRKRTAFYRSKRGQELFLRLRRETSEFFQGVRL